MIRSLPQIARIRLSSQYIEHPQATTPKQVVAHMGAMQAQDYLMAKYAIGIRLPGLTNETLEKALDDGDIIRTHVMRPTWHFVAAEDLHWMLELTAPQIWPILKSANKQFGLTDAIMKKSRKILEQLFADGAHLTRDEIVAALEAEKIATGENRASHILMAAELDGLLCSGARKDGKNTYAPIAGRVPSKNICSRDEALARLADRFFTSHCPATVKDFVWWSGLLLKDAKKAAAMLQPSFTEEVIDGEPYLIPPGFTLPRKTVNSIHLLPAFDEFIIGYRDRSAALAAEHNRRTISINGIFKATVVIDGQVRGLWKWQSPSKPVLTLDLDTFHSNDEATKKKIEKAAGRLGRFMDKKITIAE